MKRISIYIILSKRLSYDVLKFLYTTFTPTVIYNVDHCGVWKFVSFGVKCSLSYWMENSFDHILIYEDLTCIKFVVLLRRV